MFTYYLDSLKEVLKVEESLNKQVNSTFLDLCTHHLEGQKIFHGTLLYAFANPTLHLEMVEEWTEGYLRKSERLSALLLKRTRHQILGIQTLANEEIYNLKRDVPFEMLQNLDTIQQSIETLTKTEQTAIDAVNTRMNTANKTVLKQIRGLNKKTTTKKSSL